MKWFRLFFLLVLFLYGCATIPYIEKKDGQYQVRPLSEREKTGNLSIQDKFPSYNTGNVSEDAKIFLVAASSNSANFLQEIVEQKRMLISLGYQQEEIVCYYVIPTELEYKRDQDQFESLIGEVDSFYLASPRNLFEHLKIARNSDIDFLYLYVTSHGSKPQGDSMRHYFSARYINSREANKQIDFLAEQFPEYFNQYYIRFDAISTGRANQVMRLHALKDKQPPEDIMFTPRYLKDILAGIRDEIKKYVVLQGCYTGGFLSTNDSILERDTLKSIPNICLMTASNNDRPSFGCSPGPDRTYFGGAFNDLLKAQNTRLEEIAWHSFYMKMKEEVELMESKKNINPKHRSIPSFFSNIGM